MDPTAASPLFTAQNDVAPSVVCKAVAPYTVVYANPAWESLCGYSSAEMLGRSLRCLQGPATDQEAVALMMHAVSQQQPVMIPSLINYDKQQRPFSHTVSVTPMLAPGESGSTAYFRATSLSVSPLQSAGRQQGTGATSASCNSACGYEAVDTTASILPFTLGSDTDCAALIGAAGGVDHGLLASQVPRSLGCGAPPNMVVLTHATPPYGIMWASPAWLDVCGFTLPEIVGNNLSCIQGPATDRVKISHLMQLVRRQRECTLHGLVNYDKRKRPFMHTLSVFPVAACGTRVTDAHAPGHAEHANGDEAHPDEAGASSSLALAAKPLKVAMLRAESRDVSLSCGGMFTPYEEQRLREMQGEEDDVWGDDFEDFLFSMNQLGGSIEHKTAKLRV